MQCCWSWFLFFGHYAFLCYGCGKDMRNLPVGIFDLLAREFSSLLFAEEFSSLLFAGEFSSLWLAGEFSCLLICRRVLQSLICLSMRGFPVTCIIYNNLKLWQGMMFIFLICLVGEYTLLISSVYWCQQNSFGFFAWDLVSNILNIQQF